jgi:hypothetical protein
LTIAAKNSLSLLTSSSASSDVTSIRGAIWTRTRERISSRNNNTLATDDMEKELKLAVSLIDILPDTSTQSASCVLSYILWLRSHRDISSNYEANILRGLIKLVKFRFASVLTEVDSIGKSSKPLDDLSIVKELRRLHRDAGHKAKKSQRSSDEGKKWLEWEEYLQCISMLKNDLMQRIKTYEAADAKENKMKKEIATIFQHYLILSFFASVPDRQRTFRELELGRSFLRVENNQPGTGAVWFIKHTADDYKTGSTYGERPPLPLSASLTPYIDDFIERWRPALLSESSSSSSFLFLQPRTGNPLTPNSLYQIVSRCCYKYKQKKTNPHLLRDMIVTHIRKNSDASEKELEALALFMGHSVSMVSTANSDMYYYIRRIADNSMTTTISNSHIQQRESYDRRTLEQKIEPAIQIMQQMIMPGED